MIRPRSTLHAAAVGCCVLMASVGRTVAPQKPFAVDVMLQTEGITEVKFGPQGRQLLIEKTGAYETSQNFAWVFTWNRERSRLLDVDLNGAAGVQPVSPDDREHVWLASYSPDGTKAAVGWFDGERAKAGVYDLKTRQLKKFDFLVSQIFCGFDCPYWISEDEFVHYTVSADEQKKQIGDTYTEEMSNRWTRDTWEGRKTAVTVWGSGAYRSQDLEVGGTLLKVDARTGKSTSLADGVFYQAALSPDRRRLATVRVMGNLDLAGAEVLAIGGSENILELAVHDFDKGGARFLPCPSCNVTLGSMRWSPGGSQLFFAARVSRHGKQVHEHYIYDFRRNVLQKFAPKDLPFETEANLKYGAFISPFLWLTDDVPVVRITRKSATSKDKDRYDWYALLPRHAPVPLTSGLTPAKDRSPLEKYVAVHDGKLLLMADGELWELSGDGRRRNLTETISEPLSPWCHVTGAFRDLYPQECGGFNSISRPADEDALAKGWLTFRIMKGEVSTDDLLFLNTTTGQSVRLAKPAPGAELVTASALARKAVYRRAGEDGDHLLLAAVGEPPRELLHFNPQLTGVARSPVVMLTRREAGETEDRYDWLLLPSDRKEGDRHPLLVYFYPDSKYSRQWRGESLREVDFLNQHIPAGHGFAVLYASMKISSMEDRGNPMTEMHEQLIHAAENVVRKGYADPQRWAIMGHSYGGYGTLGVITQTHRFKAAVALASVANLSSGYAIGLSDVKTMSSVPNVPFGVLWSEGGQGRMGVAPWQNPQRYIDNSPLFHADKIETPLMLVHGDYDFIGVAEAEQMFNALHRQNKDAQLVRYWGEGHMVRSPANMRDLWNRIFTWFDIHLDIARDGQGKVLFENHLVKSRNQ